MKIIYYTCTPFFIVCVLFIILIAPAKAQSIDTQSQIQLLLKQLTILQEQLRILTARTSSTQPISNQRGIEAQNNVKESWEKRFVSNGTKVPKNALRAFYFDTKSPGTTIFEEVVSGADTHYLPDNQNLSKIAQDGFGGYWIGNYVFTKEQMYTIHIAQGSSESRIRINGVVVFKGTESKSFNYNFTPGIHKVEIEQVNKNWTMSGSTIFLLPWVKTYTTSELKTALEPQWKNKSSQVWLASPYDIGGADRTITIALKPTSVPTTLVLSSYIATTWAYPTSSKANIKAIVLSSNDKGSSIKNVPLNIPVYVLSEGIENVDGNNLITTCQITDDYCSRDNDVRPAALKVATFFGGKKPAGIGSISNSRVLVIPVAVLDESDYQKLDASVTANDKARSDYKKSKQLQSIFPSH